MLDQMVLRLLAPLGDHGYVLPGNLIDILDSTERRERIEEAKERLGLA